MEFQVPKYDVVGQIARSGREIPVRPIARQVFARKHPAQDVDGQPRGLSGQLPCLFRIGIGVCRVSDFAAVAVLSPTRDPAKTGWRDEAKIMQLVCPDNGHAVERDRPDVPQKCLGWFNDQIGLERDKLVAIPFRKIAPQSPGGQWLSDKRPGRYPEYMPVPVVPRQPLVTPGRDRGDRAWGLCRSSWFLTVTTMSC